MKRLALLLGSLLVVTAAASAKEVVPAPVVVEEAPVQVVEKEVIVYRDKEEGFRPNGFVDLQYRYYGQTEGKDNYWNGGDNYSRTQLEGKIQMTEKQALDFRVRDYNSLDHANGSLLEKGATSAEDKYREVSSTAVRLRYYYDHGNIEGTNVGMSSFVKYEKNLDNSLDQSLEYQYRFDLTNYFFNNDFIKTTNFLVGPSYKYAWADGNDSGYANSLGLYMIWDNQLPWGFSTEVELDGLHYNMYGDNARVADARKDNLKDNDITANVNLYLYHDANLYANGAYSLDWHFEGGYDSYNYSNRDKFTKSKAETYDGEKYSAYAQPSVTLSYQATDFVTLYGTVGAEYRNWNIENASQAQDWRWQPYAVVGVKTTF